MDRHAAATSETDRQTACCNQADSATLDNMAATQDRTAAIHSSTVATSSSHSREVRAAAQHKIRSEEGAHSLDSHRRR